MGVLVERSGPGDHWRGGHYEGGAEHPAARGRLTGGQAGHPGGPAEQDWEVLPTPGDTEDILHTPAYLVYSELIININISISRTIPAAVLRTHSVSGVLAEPIRTGEPERESELRMMFNVQLLLSPSTLHQVPQVTVVGALVQDSIPSCGCG